MIKPTMMRMDANADKATVSSSPSLELSVMRKVTIISRKLKNIMPNPNQRYCLVFVLTPVLLGFFENFLNRFEFDF
jgi:hypothetical protein